jgi:hypothetical protein
MFATRLQATPLDPIGSTIRTTDSLASRETSLRVELLAWAGDGLHAGCATGCMKPVTRLGGGIETAEGSAKGVWRH